MPRPTTTFSLNAQPEVFFSTSSTSRAIRRHFAAGELRHVAGRLYTKNLVDPVAEVVRRNAWTIAGGYFPGSVITDRTAFELRPSGPEGSLFLAASTRRVVRLPGLVINARQGVAPATGDTPFMETGLYLSSWPRRFLDNARSSRARSGVARTLAPAELEERLEEILVNVDESELSRLRDEARELAVELDARQAFQRLDGIIGTLLATRDEPLASARARATADGVGWDERRLPLFDALLAALHGRVSVDRPERPAQTKAPFAFFEAYFSNYIEGTEFLVEEAEDIVFEGAIPSERPQDAHDVLGTYAIVSDAHSRVRVPANADELEEILRAMHARMLAARPEVAPGEYKRTPNRAGQTQFVAPRAVRGTLARGMERYLELRPGFPRAVFAMFLVAEVHPFVDGNGRVARALANAELSAAGQQRIVVPTLMRDDYLFALRALSRTTRPEPLIRVLDRAQRFSAELDWRDLRSAERQLTELHAFDSPDSGLRLRLPSELRPQAFSTSG